MARTQTGATPSAAGGDAINQTMGAVEWGMVLLLGAIWGGSFFFVGVAVHELPPLSIVAVRVGLAALALQLWLTLRGPRPRLTAPMLGAMLGMGVLNNVIPFTLIVWGQTGVASGLASIINATMPIFTVVVAHFLTDDEKLSGRRAVGVLIGALGVATLVGPSALEGLGASSALPYQLALLGAALAYGFGGVWGRRFRKLGVAPLEAAAGQVTASSLIMIPLALMVDQPFALPTPSMETILSLLGLSLLCTAAAYGLYFRILSSAGANNLSLVTLIVPLVAILLGALFLGESLGWRAFAGLGLIAAALAVMDGRLLRRRAARRGD